MHCVYYTSSVFDSSGSKGGSGHTTCGKWGWRWAGDFTCSLGTPAAVFAAVTALGDAPGAPDVFIQISNFGDWLICLHQRFNVFFS